MAVHWRIISWRRLGYWESQNFERLMVLENLANSVRRSRILAVLQAAPGRATLWIDFSTAPSPDVGGVTGMTTYRHLNVVLQGDVTLIQFAEPRLSDSLLLGQLRDELMDVLERAKPRKLVIDFGRVTHGSTVVINCLLDAKTRLTAAGGRMKLCNMSPNVRGSYRLLNLDGSVFEIYDSADEALAAF